MVSEMSEQRPLRNRAGRATAVSALGAVSLAIAGLSAGCCCLPDCGSSRTPGNSVEDEPINYTMPVPVPLSVPQIWELAGSEAIKKAGASSAGEISSVPPDAYERRLRKAGIVYYVGFGSPVGFRRIGDTKDAIVYEVITFKDQSVVTGKYSVKVTLDEATTGGPPGTATERLVRVSELKLVERTLRAKPIYSAGAREILPGERIVRRIAAEDVTINDEYGFNLDVPDKTSIWISLYPDEHLSVSVTSHKSKMLPLENFRDKLRFDATSGEQYVLRVFGRMRNERRPDRYILVVTIGEVWRGYDTDLLVDRVKWSSPSRPEQ